jgi:hypothetical protein
LLEVEEVVVVKLVEVGVDIVLVLVPVLLVEVVEEVVEVEVEVVVEVVLVGGTLGHEENSVLVGDVMTEGTVRVTGNINVVVMPNYCDIFSILFTIRRFRCRSLTWDGLETRGESW